MTLMKEPPVKLVITFPFVPNDGSSAPVASTLTMTGVAFALIIADPPANILPLLNGSSALKSLAV